MCSERPALRNALFVLATVLVLLIPHTAAAQPEDRRLGVGILVGGFSGLSAKYYFGPSHGVHATDLHLSIDIGSEFSAMAHLLLERALQGSPLVFVWEYYLSRLKMSRELEFRGLSEYYL